MLFNGARLSARNDDSGNLLRLLEQDRSIWNQAMIARGLHYLALASSGEIVSEYHLEAGIAACHSTVVSAADTDWSRILALYDCLKTLTQSPIVALNRAVALGRVKGPQVALDALTAIPARSPLESNHLFHAVRGSFLSELQRREEALAAFRMAEAIATLPSERELITRLIQELET